VSDLWLFLTEFFAKYGALLWQGTIATLIMTLVSSALAYGLGIPLGVLLMLSAPDSLKPNRLIYTVLGWIVNIGRSIPFIILMVAIIPFSRLVMGTSLGVKGAIVPLVVAATPFVARLIENSLQEVPAGVIEAAQSYGATTLQIVRKVLLSEALPSIARSVPITVIAIFGYTAIAGVVGAGGLGDIAVRFGYQRYQTDVMIATIIVMVLLIQLIQTLGNIVVRRIDKR
jgi:D-methionine transport system permease protein